MIAAMQTFGLICSVWLMAHGLNASSDLEFAIGTGCFVAIVIGLLRGAE